MYIEVFVFIQASPVCIDAHRPCPFTAGDLPSFATLRQTANGAMPSSAAASPTAMATCGTGALPGGWSGCAAQPFGTQRGLHSQAAVAHPERWLPGPFTK